MSTDPFPEEGIATAIALLRHCGYRVRRAKRKEEWTISELARTLNRRIPTIHARLHSQDCPPWKATFRGPTGRVIYFTVTPAVRAFLMQPLQPGRRA